MKSVYAVVPLCMSDCLDESQAAPRFQFRSKPLWDATILQAISSSTINKVVIAYDNEKILNCLDLERYNKLALKYLHNPAIIPLHRPPSLSQAGITSLDVLKWAATMIRHTSAECVRLVLLEITHPLRPENFINQLVNTAYDLHADTLITCHKLNYNIWIDSNNNLVEQLKVADSFDSLRLYQEMLGIGSVFMKHCLESDDPFAYKVHLLPIASLWSTIDVRNLMALEVAEFLARSHWRE